MHCLLDDARVYDFRQANAPLQSTGLASPEVMGRWTVDEIVEITIPFRMDDKPFAAIVFEYFAHVRAEALPMQRVSLSVDDQPVEEWELRDGWYRKRALIIDKSALKRRSHAKLTLSMPDSISPHDLGVSGDLRRLGVLIRRIHVLEIGERPAPGSPLMEIGRRYVGTESRKRWDDRHLNGFWRTFLTGPNVLDIGFSSYGDPNVHPIVEGAIGVDIGFPGYDGRTLPFADGSQDAVYSSHCLEHIPDPLNAIQDWFRVIKRGGHVIISVPSGSLFERRRRPPSRWNAEHLRMYSLGSLASEIEAALEPNTFRIRWSNEDDEDYDYSRPLDQPPSGNYEITAVIEKIERPSWRMED